MVFTIHNAEYGLDRIGSAAYYSQRFTTVSPSYAGEVRVQSCKASWKYSRRPLEGTPQCPWLSIPHGRKHVVPVSTKLAED